MVFLHDNISFALGENQETQVIAGLLEKDLGVSYLSRCKMVHVSEPDLDPWWYRADTI